MCCRAFDGMIYGKVRSFLGKSKCCLFHRFFLEVFLFDVVFISLVMGSGVESIGGVVADVVS